MFKFIYLIHCSSYVRSLFRDRYSFRFFYPFAAAAAFKGPISFKKLSAFFRPKSVKMFCAKPKKGFGDDSNGPNKNEPKREQVEPSAILGEHARPLNWDVVSAESRLIQDQRPPMVYASFSPYAKVIIEQRFETALEPYYRSKYYLVYSPTFKWLQSEQFHEADLRDTPPIYRSPFDMGNYSREANAEWERRVAAYEKKEALLFDRCFVQEEIIQKGGTDLDSEKNLDASGLASPDMGTEKASVVEIPTTESLYDSSKTGNSLPENPGKRKTPTKCQQMALVTKNGKIELKSSNLVVKEIEEIRIKYVNSLQEEEKTLREEEFSLKEALNESYSKRRRKTAKSGEVLKKKISKLEKSFEKKRIWVQKAYSCLITLCEKKLTQMEKQLHKQEAKILAKEKAKARALFKKTEKEMAKALKKNGKKF